ncbi:SAM-dependent methyltransferase [Embleya sp. NPDC020630]|uniref:SAM-dependent methyltransferase n=1 Tax=Embleya sp. NPDC020630 TaxID=3363979 RepID=UPI003787DCE7
MRSKIARTSIEATYVRAEESRRPDRLFDDPFAPLFIAASEQHESDPAEVEARATWKQILSFNVIVRTRFFDEYLLAATEAGCRQVVLVGAGLDARAYRLDWPAGVHLYEIDLGDLLDFKNEVLDAADARPRCARDVLMTDLRDDDWPARLVAGGFDPTAPTAWLVEGVLGYLTADEAARLLGMIGDLSASGSRMSFEHANLDKSAFLAEAKAVPGLAEIAAMAKGGLGEGTMPWLGENGWDARLLDRADVAASYGRQAQGRSNGGLLTAVRR